MSIRTISRLRTVSIALLALVALAVAAPSAMARGSFGISIAVPGIGISYSDYGGRYSRWGGYASAGYSSYPGYYGGSPYYSAYNGPYYQPYYRPSYGSYYGGRNVYRPSRVVYYDRHDRGHHSRYDDRSYDRDDRGYRRDGRYSDNSHYERRGGYYDRGR